MNKQLQKIAEILVECGMCSLATEYQSGKNIGFFVKHTPTHKRLIKWTDQDKIAKVIECFDDTLEGRRQADAIEDYLARKRPIDWVESCIQLGKRYDSEREWQLERIKWCIESLIGGEK